tara:strand:+ start:50 stop:550 length:501 start_codon:yes stop_codon:yes gene_type:complete
MSKEIEVKLVLDTSELETVNYENVVEDVSRKVVQTCDFSDDVESALQSSDTLYELNDRLDVFAETLDDTRNYVYEYDLDEIQDDLRRDDERIDELKERVDALEAEGKLDWRTEFGTRLEALEDKVLGEVVDSSASVAMLVLRVDRLEEINERLMYLIRNIQGVEIT